MENPFEYPEDRAELFTESNQEEAHFYFTLSDFENLVSKHGIDFVMNRLSEDVFIKLATWFLEDDEEDWMLDV